ncbi:IC140 [Auxenochlorella protothecoides x Auxenochlorella symbiontica]
MPELDDAQAAVMVRFLQSMEPMVHSALDANLACDICAEELDEELPGLPEASGLGSGRHPPSISASLRSGLRGAVLHLEWHPSFPGHLLAVHAGAEPGSEPGEAATLAAWDTVAPLHPRWTAALPARVTAASRCPLDPRPLALACEYGEVGVWAADPRASPGCAPALFVGPACQAAPCTCTAWLPGVAAGRGQLVAAAAEPTCSLFATGALDGSVAVWEATGGGGCRHEPALRARLTAEAGGRPMLVTALAPLPRTQALPQPGTMLVGCLEGSLALVSPGRTEVGGEAGALSLMHAGHRGFWGRDWVHSDWSSSAGSGGKATVTELPPAAQAAQATLAAHASPLGAIVAMTLHPELPGLILIVGGLGWGLCQPSSLEDLPPFFLSPSAPAAHTCGRWSPTRPAVLCLGRADGLMEVWDLLRGQSCPVQTLQVTDTAVTSLEFDPAQQGQAVAVGTATGEVHLVQLPRAVHRQSIRELEDFITWVKGEKRAFWAAESAQETAIEHDSAGKLRTRNSWQR